jgi:large subunit ribosomal protein L3
MKYLLGTKEYMTELFDENGMVHPVTLLKVGPLKITQVKTKAKDGYESIQLGFGEKKAKLLNKPMKGHVKDLGNFRTLKEVRTEKADKKDWSVGDLFTANDFAAGDKVVVSSISKGKGFQGVIKRHGFKGGPRSHGQKHSERAPGSIGTAGYQRVFKNIRMAGRMGGDLITVKNLKVVKVDVDAGEIFIKGAIPGRRGTLVEIKG